MQKAASASPPPSPPAAGATAGVAGTGGGADHDNEEVPEEPLPVDETKLTAAMRLTYENTRRNSLMLFDDDSFSFGHRGVGTAARGWVAAADDDDDEANAGSGSNDDDYAEAEEAGPSGLSGDEVRKIYAFLRKASAPEVALYPNGVEQWAMRHVHAISNEEAWRATFAKQLAQIDLQLQQVIKQKAADGPHPIGSLAGTLAA